MGAYPPPFVPSKWVDRLSTYGPTLPGPVTAAEWKAYSKSALKAPVMLLGAGALVAVVLFCCLCCGGEVFKDHQSRTPPFLVIIWLLLTVGLIGGGLIVRHSQVVHTFDLGVQELGRMRLSFINAGKLGDQLSADFETVKTSVNSVPASCHVKLAKDAMGAGVKGANKVMDKVLEEITKFNNAVQPLPGKIEHLIDLSTKLRFVFMWIPSIPLGAMLVTSVLFTLGTLVLHTDAAQTAECCMSRVGSGSIALLIALAVCLGALQLEASIVVGGFCSNVDAHVIGLIQSKEFLKTEHGKVINMTRPVHKAAHYYIYGDERNPFLNFLANANYSVGMMQRAMDKAQKAASMAEKTCPQITNVYTERAFAGMSDSIVQAERWLLAENMWPYYDNLVHQLLCHDFIDGEAFLVCLTTVIALFVFPVLVLLVEARLESERQGGHKEIEDSPEHGHYNKVAPKGSAFGEYHDS